MPEITTWLIDRGISETILMIVSYVPLIVTITAISRYILGIKTFGVYTSMILSLAYYFMGLRQGLVITFIVILSSLIVRNLLKKVQLNYLARIGAIYTGEAILLLAFIIGTTFIRSDDPFFDFTALPPLPLAMIMSVTDRFISNYIKRDFIGAARLTIETILIALFGWVLIRSHETQMFLINNLWLIPLVFIVNYIIGSYKGFRLTEIARFKQIIKSQEATLEDEE
jgi:hypothetical protein